VKIVKRLLVIVVLLALAPAALASPEKPNAAVEKLTDAQKRHHARIWFERGRDQFERLRHYDEAIASFSESYRYEPRPLILFDIGNVARVAGMNDVATDYFRRYLKAAAPLEPEVAEARHWLNKLGGRETDDDGSTATRPPASVVAPTAAAAIPAAAVPPPAPARDRGIGARTTLIAGITVGSVGVVLAATGIGLLAHSGSIGNQLVEDSHDGRFDPALYDRGSREQVAGSVLVGVGAAAVVAGTVVTILGARQRRHQHQAARLAPSAVGLGGGGLVVGWP
jgi:hypothetical protein